jgi:hypothetical protein
MFNRLAHLGGDQQPIVKVALVIDDLGTVNTKLWPEAPRFDVGAHVAVHGDARDPGAVAVCVVAVEHRWHADGLANGRRQ